MKIFRQNTYSQKPGYNRRGFLTSPFLASDETLDEAIENSSKAKDVWKGKKSLANLVFLAESGINGVIAKKEKRNREQLKNILDKEQGLRQRLFREKVPADIAQKGRVSGVVQKDHKGSWRIISYKKAQPEFWDAHYKTKSDAEAALGAYHANK